MIKQIGGYFELELNDYGSVFHDKAVAVNSGRNALQYILLTNKKYDKIWIPYYTCDVILQPLKKLKYKYQFYSLTQNLLPDIKSFSENDLLLYVNYFGIMNHKLNILKKYFRNIIVDNSQSFYSKPLKSIGSFYSPRKFFGLPDGGFVYTNKKLKIKLQEDHSFNRFNHLLMRIENGPEAGYDLFKENDKKLNNLPLRRMSDLTQKLLRNIKFDEISDIRNKNFNFLHNALKSTNELTHLIDKENLQGPMVYPFLNKANDNLRKSLIKNKIYVATYWPNVIKWVKNDSWEGYLTNYLIPIPIDQRYDFHDLKLVLELING